MNRHLHNKHKIPQLVKTFLVFYKNQMFIIIFLTSHLLYLFWVKSNPVHDLPAHFLKIPFYIILLSLCSLPSGLFPSGFHTKTLYTCLISCLCHMSHPSHLPWINDTNTILCRVQIIKLFTMPFPLVPCYWLPLRPKYLPVHAILKRTQPTFVP